MSTNVNFPLSLMGTTLFQLPILSLFIMEPKLLIFTYYLFIFSFESKNKLICHNNSLIFPVLGNCLFKDFY